MISTRPHHQGRCSSRLMEPKESTTDGETPQQLDRDGVARFARLFRTTAAVLMHAARTKGQWPCGIVVRIAVALPGDFGTSLESETLTSSEGWLTARWWVPMNT
jgi:hypothetical protein